MCRHDIEKTLAGIFMKRFSMNFLQEPEMKEMKLLGKSSITARELLHVYFDVKNIFGISIPEDDVAEGRFDTFTHIMDIIWEQTSGHTADILDIAMDCKQKLEMIPSFIRKDF